MDELTDQELEVICQVLEMVKDSQSMWGLIPDDDKPHFLTGLDKLSMESANG